MFKVDSGEFICNAIQYQLLMRLTLVHVGHYITTSPYPVNLFIYGDIYSLLKLCLKLTSNFIIQHHTWS